MRRGCVGGSCRKLPAHIVVAHGGCAYLGGSPARIGTGQSKRPCKLGKRLRGRLQSELIPKIRGGPASGSSSNNPPPYSPASPPATATTPPHTPHCRYHYRSSTRRYYLLRAVVPLPARCRLRDLAPGSLDCCPMQLGLSVATTPAGSGRPSTRHYCGVRL